ncbi:unnamed protein product [Adineta steineri]|uniref:Uncharacterized protein n=1 Tax=Adineta steineri TaxID=433720 RepID=A0A814UTN4_9BILA|nr:unnamed protein product [Adineta steineri]CAF3909735.1 unnamed protein product [Adineta steineri]
MSTSSRWLSFKTHWVMETHRALIIITGVLYLIILCIFLAGTRELHRAKTYITRNCFVKSFYFTTKRNGKYDTYKPNWNVTLTDDGDSYESNNNQPSDAVITSSSSYYSKSTALSVAKSVIGQTHPCYGAPEGEGWCYEWTQPSKQQAYFFMSLALIFFIILTGLMIIRYIYQRKLKSTTTQQETEPTTEQTTTPLNITSEL